jgi:hypothetical protein
MLEIMTRKNGGSNFCFRVEREGDLITVTIPTSALTPRGGVEKMTPEEWEDYADSYRPVGPQDAHLIGYREFVQD